MKGLTFLYNKCFVADSLLVQAEKKLETQKQDLFNAQLRTIQWECQVNSHEQQMEWLNAFIQGYKNAENK